MLEFIVLGLVPGTDFQISLQHVATIGWMTLIVYMSIRIKQARQSQPVDELTPQE